MTSYTTSAAAAEKKEAHGVGCVSFIFYEAKNKSQHDVATAHEILAVNFILAWKKFCNIPAEVNFIFT